MNKIKIAFADCEIEIESSDETTEQIVNRAVNGISFLIQERLKLSQASEEQPAEDDTGTIPEPQEITPHEPIKPEIRSMYA